MPRYARKRDCCERAIIDALKSVGASVTQLDVKGCADLLVGLDGATYLIECKDAHGSDRKHGKKTQTGLRETQDAWHAAWRGAKVVIVTTPAEALAAVGRQA